MYAAIGGYLPELEGGEDIAIGQAILEARKKTDSIMYAGARVSRLYTSARRAIKALESGLSPVEQWDRGFSAFDNEVRNFELGADNDIDYDSPDDLLKLKNNLQCIIDRTLDVYEQGEKLGKSAAYYKKALRYLGIKYSLDENNNVVILNMDEVVANFRNYQNTALKLKTLKARQGSDDEIKKIKEELKNLADEHKKKVDIKLINSSKEKKKLDEKVQSKLDNFHREQHSLLEISNPKHSINDLIEDDNHKNSGDFVICPDKVLGKGEHGEVVAGYNKNTNEIFSFKKVKKDKLEFLAKANEYPNGVIDVEDYIKERSASPLLGVNHKKIEAGSEIIKVYPIASQDLNNYIKNDKLGPKESLSMLINIAEGVRELHKNNILHLDLSPTNILLSKDGVKIIDFDAASIKNNGKFTRGFVGGYKEIIPPELFDENPVIGEYSDTYELAVLLYRLAVGNYPYKTTKNISKDEISEDLKKKHLENKLSIPQNTPDGIKRIIEKGIKPEPKDRYQNVNEMLLDLLAAYAEPIAEEKTLDKELTIKDQGKIRIARETIFGQRWKNKKCFSNRR